jgi:hypothetical protein
MKVTRWIKAGILLAVVGGCGAGNSPFGQTCNTSGCPGGSGQSQYKDCTAGDYSVKTISRTDGSNSTDCQTVNSNYSQCVQDAIKKACQ